MEYEKAVYSRVRRPSFIKRGVYFIFSAFFALISLWLGISIPSYFRSVAPIVLEAAGKDSPKLEDHAQAFLDEGRLGSARSFIFLMPPSPEKDLLSRKASQLIGKQPNLKYSGGSDPFYDQFLEAAPFLNSKRPQVIANLLPPENRQILLSFLEESLNSRVHQILKTRKLDTWQVFLPVFSKAGQPLDATILTTALLEQSSAFSPGLREHLLRILPDPDSAITPDSAALEELESTYASLLNLANQLDWSQLKAIVGKTSDLPNLMLASTFTKKTPEQFQLFISAILSVEDPDQLYNYIRKYPDRGWKGVEMSLRYGSAAFETLFTLNNPPFSPPSFWESLPEQITGTQTSFMGFAADYPQLSLIIRAIAFGLCGYFLVNMIRHLLMPRNPRDAGKRLLVNLDAIVGGVLVMFVIWIIIEPGLLEFRPNEQGTLSLNLASFLPQSTLEPEPAVSDMIDQVTIIILVIFFVLQLLVFIFSLLKLSEIRRQNVPVETKIRLLDNEENLFDLGLYVGLGGTVFSLIMVVLNFVDASLMAAYASTLFGIIFVASLKIGFLRPLKRSLILSTK